MKQWMMLALMAVGMGLLAVACEEKEDDEGQVLTPHIVSKEYKDYLSPGGLRNDTKELVSLLAKYELLELQFIKMEAGDWQKPLFSTYDYSETSMDHFFEVLGEAVEHADEYEAAIQRLSASGALGTATPETRAGFDNIPFYTAVNILGYLKASGKACRAAIIGVVQKSGHANDAAWLKARYDRLAPARQRGATDYADWWNKFSRGEFDSRACTIFGDIMSADYTFVEAANELGVTRSGTIRDVAVPMIMSGVNLVLNLTPTGTIAAETMEILTNVTNLADSVSAGGETGGTLVKTISSVAKTAYNHFGNAPASGGNEFYGDILENAQKELLLGGTSDLEERIAETIDNITEKTSLIPTDKERLKETSKSIVEITDQDKQTPADVAIATDENGDNITVGTPDKDGKIKLPVPGNKNMSTTAIDKNGDKNTQQTKVPTGDTQTVEVSTNEKELVETEEDMEVELDPEELVFDADPDNDEYVDVYTNIKYFKARSTEKWITVEQNASTIRVTVEENTGKDDREGYVVIDFSKDQDMKNIIKTCSVHVLQNAPVDADLSFINWDKFRIQELENIQVDIWKSDWNCHNELTESFVFPHKSLSIKKVNDAEYEVTGIVSDDTKWSKNSSDPYLLIETEKPYGIHYDVSFRVVALNPGDLIEKNNFELRDIKVKGFHKDSRVASGGFFFYSDSFEEFDFYFEKAGPDYDEYDYGKNPGKICKLGMVTENLGNIKSQLKRRYRTTKVTKIDDNYSIIDTDFIDENDTWTSTSIMESIFDVVVRWD